MKIIWCSNLVAFPSYFPRLKFLAIHQCSGLDTLPDMRRFSELRRLELVDCEILSSLPEGITALKSLYIAGCPELEALPEGLQQRMPNLESFSIDDSPSLARKCKHGGVYWDRVKDIPELNVSVESYNVEQHSGWQHVTRAIIAGCRSAWYRVICELISAFLLASMVHLLSLPHVPVHHSMLFSSFLFKQILKIFLPMCVHSRRGGKMDYWLLSSCTAS
jgi:hypothetical protein